MAFIYFLFYFWLRVVRLCTCSFNELLGHGQILNSLHEDFCDEKPLHALRYLDSIQYQSSIGHNQCK